MRNYRLRFWQRSTHTNRTWVRDAARYRRALRDLGCTNVTYEFREGLPSPNKIVVPGYPHLSRINDVVFNFCIEEENIKVVCNALAETYINFDWVTKEEAREFYEANPVRG